MYDLIDRPVERLGQGSRFILWAMRAWVTGIGKGQCPTVVLSPGFARMGLLRALPDFHMAMALLNRDALEKLHFAPMAACRIGEDEALLLGLWRDVVHDRRAAAEAVLNLMIDEDSVALTLAAVGETCRALNEVGYQPCGLAGNGQAARP